MKKTFASILAVILAISLTACGANSNETAKTEPTKTETNTPAPAAKPEEEKVTIIIANGKGELAEQYQQAAKDFMAANPNITVEAHVAAVGEAIPILDKLTASGEIVTLAMQSPGAILDKYKDFGMDLTGEKWLEETTSAVIDANGKITGFPFAIEGFGLIYNKKVVEKAVGGTFDPFSINTRDKLKELFDKIKASGVKFPVAYQTEVWSVGSHYSTQFFNQVEDGFDIVAQLKEGKFDLANNAVWNGYYDTMDMLASKEYNKYADRPLDKLYDDAHLSVGSGDAAVLFNGNWAYDSLKALPGDVYGFMPVPNDNNPDNPMNNKITAGATQAYMINKKATPAQQEAAKKYLNWLVYDKVGQDFYVNKSQVISAFKNNPNKVSNSLGIAVSDALTAGKTMPFSNIFINGGDWSTIIGPEIQKYIAKKTSRADLAKFMVEYYKK